MKEVAAMHDEAMDLLDLAQIALKRKEAEAAKELLLAAFKAESAAAEAIRNAHELEPSRSIVLKSAAIIGMRVGLYREAEKWASLALAGNCPAPIADELRTLLKRICFQMFLADRGDSIPDGALRVSLDGSQAGTGLVKYDLLNQRLAATAKVLVRAADRKSNLQFRNLTGRAHRVVVPYVGAFADGSFMFDLKLGTDSRQNDALVDNVVAGAIADVVVCFDLLEKNNLAELKQHLGSAEYYNNFIGLARDIMPDGEAISHVGLAAVTADGLRSVSVTRSKKTVTILDIPEDPSDHALVTLEGVLRLANSLGGKHEVAIENVKNKRKVGTFVVPDEMMDDIVRPRWNQFVRITGRAELDQRGRPLLKKKIEFLQFEDSPEA